LSGAEVHGVLQDLAGFTTESVGIQDFGDVLKWEPLLLQQNRTLFLLQDRPRNDVARSVGFTKQLKASSHFASFLNE